MQKELRKAFNDQFTQEKYQQYVEQIESLHPGALDFRNAETPIYIPKDFTAKMLNACEDILDLITADNFKALTERSIPKNLAVPGEDDHPECLVFDFGICENKNGEPEPQLIEMQGFPTLYAFQAFHTEITAAYANMPDTHSAYLNGYDKETYTRLLKEIILGNEQPEKRNTSGDIPRTAKKQESIFTAQNIYWA